MVFNETAVSLFNESDSYFNLLVYEKNNINLYKDAEKKFLAGKIEDINYKVVTVEELNTDYEEFFYKINYRNKIKAYLYPDGSIPIIPKGKQQAKLKFDIKFDNELNLHLDLDDRLYESVKNKIFYSSSFAIYKNVIYETIIYKNEIVGFFPITQVEHLIRFSTSFTIPADSLIYKDSSLQKETNVIQDHYQEYQSDFIIPSSHVIRFKYGRELCWVPLSSTNVNYVDTEFNPKNPSDVLLKSIVHQYQDKLRKSHQYHLKIMKQEIKKAKGD